MPLSLEQPTPCTAKRTSNPNTLFAESRFLLIGGLCPHRPGRGPLANFLSADQTGVAGSGRLAFQSTFASGAAAFPFLHADRTCDHVAVIAQAVRIAQRRLVDKPGPERLVLVLGLQDVFLALGEVPV